MEQPLSGAAPGGGAVCAFGTGDGCRSIGTGKIQPVSASVELVCFFKVLAHDFLVIKVYLSLAFGMSQRLLWFDLASN